MSKSPALSTLPVCALGATDLGHLGRHRRPWTRKNKEISGVREKLRPPAPGSLGEESSAASSGSDKASIFSSSSGAIEIKDGIFNAAAGHHFNVTINAGGLPGEGSKRPKVKKSRKQKAKFAVPDENTSSVGRATSRVKSSGECSESSEEIWTPNIPTQRSCDIYYRHLAPKGRGSPLWIPEPNKRLPIEYQRAGMQIGDVGIITSWGSFDFLFNICLPANHPINPPELPENFTTLSISPTDIQEYSEFKDESYLSSASIKKSQSRNGVSSGLRFESSASEGAILTMPVGSNSEDVGNVVRFRKYAALHAEHWYKYVKTVRGREARNGDVRLVTGYDKTTAWGMATFSNSRAQDDSFHLQFRPLEQGSVDRTYGWEYSGMAEVRAGPDACETEALRRGDPSQEGMKYENQCLFVRTLNVKLQDEIWRKLASECGEVDVHEEPGDASGFRSSSTRSHTNIGPSAPTVQVSSSSSGSRPGGRTVLAPIEHNSAARLAQLAYVSPSSPALTGHPSEFLNQILLALSPQARIAITEDRDWISVLRAGDTVLPSKEELYARLASSFHFREEEGILFLEKKGNYRLTSDSPVGQTLIAMTSDSVPKPEIQLKKDERENYLGKKDKKPIAFIFTDQRFDQMHKRREELRARTEEYRKYADYLESLLNQYGRSSDTDVLLRSSPDVQDHNSNSTVNDTDNNEKSTDSDPTKVIHWPLQNLKIEEDGIIRHYGNTAPFRFQQPEQPVQSSRFPGLADKPDAIYLLFIDGALDECNLPHFEWSKHLPTASPLDLGSHDKILDLHFKRFHFLRDIYQSALGTVLMTPCTDGKNHAQLAYGPHGLWERGGVVVVNPNNPNPNNPNPGNPARTKNIIEDGSEENRKWDMMILPMRLYEDYKAPGPEFRPGNVYKLESISGVWQGSMFIPAASPSLARPAPRLHPGRSHMGCAGDGWIEHLFFETACSAIFSKMRCALNSDENQNQNQSQNETQAHLDEIDVLEPFAHNAHWRLYQRLRLVCPPDTETEPQPHDQLVYVFLLPRRSGAMIFEGQEL